MVTSSHGVDLILPECFWLKVKESKFYDILMKSTTQDRENNAVTIICDVLLSNTGSDEGIQIYSK